ncbi:MAG: methyltransferase domain-containing protein [Chloroflexi bacterium]|nr:methyltransferase domain-containing protein [Chloroflexota bacterium]
MPQESPQKDSKDYIPALGFDFLTPFYDSFQKWLGREKELKGCLLQEAQIASGHRVLDLGCGTATLTILIKQNHPQAEVMGLDADPKILAIARCKVSRSGLDIRLDQGLAYELPYPANSFDRILSSLVFHHLNTQQKQLAFEEVFRVLKPRGELHILDFGKPHNFWGRVISLYMRLHEEAADNISGLLPEMLRQEGFEHVSETVRFMTLFGTISVYRGQKPQEKG